jgi:hypothetical protein
MVRRSIKTRRKSFKAISRSSREVWISFSEETNIRGKALQTLEPITTINDDHDILCQIGHMISVQRGSLAPRYCDLFSMHPMERIANVERPDVFQRLLPIPASEYPDLVLIEHSGVRASWRGEGLRS